MDETRDTTGPRTDARRRVLERHVDHLLAQLHHQVSLLESSRAENAELKRRADALDRTAAALEEANRTVLELRGHVVGSKEVEVELRRRVDVLEQEDRRKAHHIERLEESLRRFTDRPHRRLWRALRAILGGRRGDAPSTGPGAADPRR